MEDHIRYLGQLCRVCGCNFSRKARRYSCGQHAGLLHLAFHISVNEDQPDTHPSHCCLNCYRSMPRLQQRKDAGMPYNCQIVPFAWSAHSLDPSKCTTCQHYEKAVKGGRPRSKVPKLAADIHTATDTAGQGDEMTDTENVDPIVDETPREENRASESVVSASSESAISHLIQHIRTIAPTGYKPRHQDILHLSQFIRPLPPLSLNEFQCNFCEGVIDRPVILKCNHIYCAECLIKSVSNVQEVSCQRCAFVANEPSDIQPPHNIILHSLGSLQVICSCRRPLPLSQFDDHTSNCVSEITRCGRQSLTPLRKAALQREFQIPVTKTPTSLERKAACHTMRRMMESSSSHATGTHLSIHTGGQVPTDNSFPW